MFTSYLVSKITSKLEYLRQPPRFADTVIYDSSKTLFQFLKWNRV